jgi:PAS domain S-box-containing protein
MPDTNGLPASFLNYFDSRRPQLSELLQTALQQHTTAYAQLPHDTQAAFVERTVTALGEALAQEQAGPLLTALAETATPADHTPPADIQAYMRMLRQCTFTILKPFVAQDPESGIAGLEHIAELLAQVGSAEVEQRLAAFEHLRDDLRQQVEVQMAEVRTFVALAENAPDGIAVVSTEGTVNYANPAFRTMTGYGDQIIGIPMTECFPPEESHRPLEIIQHVLEHGSWQGIAKYQRKDRSTFQGHLSVFAIRDTDGRPLAFPGIARDITDQLRHEQERITLQEQVIATQQAMLREISTPIIPLADDVIVMPLVGGVDSTRAQQVLEILLEGVVTHHAVIAILDITGVPIVDTHVANALVRTARAVKLLGTQLVLTGIRPEVAQTIVGLSLDLRDIVTQATLQSGIAFALVQRGRSTL